MAEDIFRIVIYLFITLACIYWAGEPFISTGTVAVTTGDRVTNIFLYLAFFLQAKKKTGVSEERRGGGEEEGRSVALATKVIILLFGRNYPHQSYRDAQLPKGIW